MNKVYRVKLEFEGRFKKDDQRYSINKEIFIRGDHRKLVNGIEKYAESILKEYQKLSGQLIVLRHVSKIVVFEIGRDLPDMPIAEQKKIVEWMSGKGYPSTFEKFITHFKENHSF